MWGNNKYGQLGLGHVTMTPVPTFVSALKKRKVTFVACGYGHTLAVIGKTPWKYFF